MFILPTILAILTVILSIDRTQYKRSMEAYQKHSDSDAILTYRIFRKVYAANPQNWGLFAHKFLGDKEYLYYVWTDPSNRKEYRIFFSSYWGYAAMKAAYRLTWFKRHSKKRRQKKIRDTEKSLEFVQTVQRSLMKQAEDAATAYEKFAEEELRKAKLRAEKFGYDEDAKKYISVFPGT